MRYPDEDRPRDFAQGRIPQWDHKLMAKTKQEVIRVVTRGRDGQLRSKDYTSLDPLLRSHPQIGVDDCSTNLALRGYPLFRGLIGPMSDGKGVIRYESPEVFETLTKEWCTTASKRKTRRRSSATAKTHV